MKLRLWFDLILRQKIFRTNYGRTAGWYVEEDGRRLALLSEPFDADMFWDSYLVTPLSNDPAERAEVMSDKFWLERNLKFKSVKFDVYAEDAFSTLHPFAEPGRVTMRRLYLDIKPFWWEWIILTLWKPNIP